MNPSLGDLAGILDEGFCRKFGILPEDVSQSPLTLIVCAETDMSVLDYLEYRVRRPLTLKRVPTDVLREMSSARFESGGSTRPGKDHHSEIPSNSNQVVSEINEIIRGSISDRASDIHFEPHDQYLRCRTRIDGQLVEKRRIDSDHKTETISRLKIMAGLDIAEKRRPQDGRIRFPHDGRIVDIRVSVIPTDFGEKVVLRLLDKKHLRLDLASLGSSPDQLETFRDRISARNGLVLVTGPTGSGKTTTLYAALSYLKRPELNISTVEDPIEYNLEGINQTQVKSDINLTFSVMLRSLLRQDPNIIMVGEIRDRETLDIAIRASMTGHLVLSTVHTNSAVATIPRLIDMGGEPYLIASALRLIVAQRLIRRNCKHCFKPGLSNEDTRAAELLGMTCSITAGYGHGCTVCSGTGLSGRVAVYELLTVDDRLREAVSNRGADSALLSIARSDGFATMTDMATRLVDDGLVRPTEVLRQLRT